MQVLSTILSIEQLALSIAILYAIVKQNKSK